MTKKNGQGSIRKHSKPFMSHHLKNKSISIDKPCKKHESSSAKQHVPKGGKHLMELNVATVDTFGMADTLTEGEYEILTKKKQQGASQFHSFLKSRWKRHVAAAAAALILAALILAGHPHTLPSPAHSPLPPK